MNCCAILTGISLSALVPLCAQQEAFRGSLSQYLALDDGGVRIGNSVFHHFRALPLQEGASSLSSRFIDVVPLVGTEGTPGFRFEIMDGATVDDFFQIRFSFEAAGPGFKGTKVELNNANVRASSNGSADVLLDLSVTGSSTGPLASLVAFAAPKADGHTEDQATFPPESNLTIEVDSVIDGGDEGTPGEIVASLGAITVTLVEAPLLPIPLLVRRSGIAAEGRFFIEFTSTPSSSHIVVASMTLKDDFPVTIPLPEGPLMTDSNGFARVEIDLSALPSSAFFLIKQTS